MDGYSLFLDESYDDAADVYVIGGVIVKTDKVAALSSAVTQVSLDLAGDPRAELKFSGANSGAARDAMAKVPGNVGGVVLVASIILDPTVDPKAGSLRPLSWAFLRSVSHFTNFLHDVGASSDPGSHVVTADRFPNKQHKTVFHAAYQEAFDTVPYGWSPRDMGALDYISEGDATFCPPLRLADFFAGTVRAWALAERRYDADPGAVTGKGTFRTRYAINRYMPHIRGKRSAPHKKSGYGLSAWPESSRAQLDLWLARTSGRRMEEIYEGPSAELKTNADGVRVLKFSSGTDRSWE